MKILKPIIYILLVLALAVGSYFAWQFYVRAKTPVLDALYMLPDDAAVIIGFNDYKAFNKQMNADNHIWQDIRNTYNLENTKSALDSLINELSKDTYFKGLIDNSQTKIYISYHFSGHNKFETVYSLSLSEAPNKSAVESFLSDRFKLKKQMFEDQILYEVSLKNSKKIFYITHMAGVISISSYLPLSEKIIASALAANPEKQGLTKRMLKMSGKDISANIYINYSYFYRLLSKYTATNYTSRLKALRGFSQKAVFDVQLQQSQISLSGFSIQNDSFPSFLNTLHGAEPTEIRVSNILPASTSFMYYQGAELISTLLKKRAKTAFSERDEEALLKLKAQLLVDVGDYFYPWMKNELVFAMSKTRSSNQDEGAYALIEVTDMKEAYQALEKLSATVVDIRKITRDTTQINYRSYEIKQIPLINLLPKLFGETFSALENSYYINIDNYIVFANSEQALHNIIDNYLIERVLSNSDVYKNTMENLSNEANIFVYANLHYLRPLINNYLSKEGLELINNSGLAFESFGTMALEFIANDEGIYTTFLLNHGGKQEVEEPISWKTALDNPIARGPFWIKNHKTNNKEVLVFDKELLMYRIDQNGSIAWAIPVMEQPMSKVYMVDYYQNGKYQYMFNSKNYIYLYDLNGNRVENYPIKLPKEATAPMTLADYDHNNNYRILIPLSDGKVYNFKIDGTQTQGWKFPKMKKTIKEAVQIFRLGTKDFIVISDTAGNVIYVNRRGESRMNAELSFTNNPHTLFYARDRGKPASIITTDLMGRIVNIDAAGKVTKILLREFSPAHQFYYFDFNGDKRKDYIFLDNNSLYVFNNREKLILQKDFEVVISPTIIGVQMKTDGEIRLIIQDQDNQKLILISEAGQIIEGEEYPSSAFFITEEATKSHILRLITTYGRIVSSFLIK